MDVGLVLPFSGQPFEPAATVRAAAATGVRDVWLRDWPRGEPAHADHGTGHDPLMYACQLAEILPPTTGGIGFAVLRLDFREVAVLARSIASAVSFSRRSLRLGFGMRRRPGPEGYAELAARWQRLRELLDQDAGRADFALPPGYTRPPFYLCSSARESWNAIDFAAEGWLAGEQHPREIAATRAWLANRAPDLRVVMQVQVVVDLHDPRSLRRTESGLVTCGTGRLRQLATAWRDSGVDHVIYRPPLGSGIDHLRAFIETVGEVRLECAR